MRPVRSRSKAASQKQGSQKAGKPTTAGILLDDAFAPTAALRGINQGICGWRSFADATVIIPTDILWWLAPIAV